MEAQEVKRNRIKLTLAAYTYECLNDSIMSDATFDRLALQVNDTLDVDTGNIVLDEWFRREFTPDTGMWIRKHPDYINGKITKLWEYLINCRR